VRRDGTDGRHAEDFFALKNPTASAGFEPANLGTRGQTTEAAYTRQQNLTFFVAHEGKYLFLIELLTLRY
jgi:hypothetical protein